MAKRFIVIAGNIGSGKTTLTELLSQRYRWEPHYEVHRENPYLSDFYGDMNRWSLQLQVYFLSKRFQAHQRILASKASAIQDRSVYEDAYIFARTLRESGKMEARDYENYLELFKTMAQFLTPPDLIVYIKRSVACLKSRIRERGIEYEQNIPEEYLKQLDLCYDDWIREYRLGKVLTVKADNLDLKWRASDLEYVCTAIENSLDQPELFSTC